jgi:hypothetical protein
VWPGNPWQGNKQSHKKGKQKENMTMKFNCFYLNELLKIQQSNTVKKAGKTACKQ